MQRPIACFIRHSMDVAGSNMPPRWEVPRLLQPFRRSIEATVWPCLALVPGGATGKAGSRLGGIPWVPWGTPWPCSPKRPMTFIGQLDFAQLSACAGGALPGLPERGVLALFYDVEEQRWGFDPADRAYFQVTWVPSLEEAVALIPPATVRDAFSAQSVYPALLPSLPSPGDSRQARFPPPFERYLERAYVALHAEWRRTRLGATVGEHQVMGHPNWLHRDARPLAERVARGLYCGGMSVAGAGAPVAAEGGEWELLWQIASDEAVGFSWGDEGTLYLLIRRADLAERAFERSWLILQCA